MIVDITIKQVIVYTRENGNVPYTDVFYTDSDTGNRYYARFTYFHSIAEIEQTLYRLRRTTLD